jgi:hypothetical protein
MSSTAPHGRKFGLQIGGGSGYTARVRQRLVIGAIAAVVIGVGAFVLSPPKEGTVEWHKAGYLKERKKIERRTLVDQFERLYVKIRKPRNYTFRKVSGDELKKHTDALVRLGFLEAKRIRVTNEPGHFSVSAGFARIPEDRRLFTQVLTGPALTLPRQPVIVFPNFVEVIAPKQDMAWWERLIHEADANVRPDPWTKNKSLTAPRAEDLPEAAGLGEVLREKDNVRRPPY